MKPTTRQSEEIQDTDDLNEAVLEAAAKAQNDLVAPEAMPGNASMTAWDESPDEAGHRTAAVPAESDETIAEQLVDAGNDEADEERRLTAAQNKSAQKAG